MPPNKDGAMTVLRIGQCVKDLWSHQFVRFLVVGAGNTAFGYGLYYLCLMLKVDYQVAVVVSTVLGVLLNFLTTGNIVFQNAELGKIIGFFAVYGFTLVVNLVLLTLAVEAGVSKALGQALVLPVIVIMSFLLNKFLVFRKST